MDFSLICIQQLFSLNLATQQCVIKNLYSNWNTIGLLATILSY